MSFLQSLILGIVQGLTEFLPVSSSAHLVLVPYIFNWSIPESQIFPFDVLVQLGTLVAVIIYFWKDLWCIIKAFVIGIIQRKPFAEADARMGWYLVLATIPAGLAGIFLKDNVEAAFNDPKLTAFFLFITAIFLVAAEFFGRRTRQLEKMNWKDALWMGVFQAFSIFPGISRSGSTITGGMTRNFDRPAAARFAFLMSIPIMLAAGVFSLPDLGDIPDLGSFLPILILGFITAGVVGYLSIHWLLSFLTKRSLIYFAAYCVLLGSAVLIIMGIRMANPQSALPSAGAPTVASSTSPLMKQAEIKETLFVEISPSLDWLRPIISTCTDDTSGLAVVTDATNTINNVDARLQLHWGEPPQLKQDAVLLGEEELVIIVNPENSLAQLPLSLLHGIIAGELSPWGQVQLACPECFSEPLSDALVDLPVDFLLYPAGDESRLIMESSILDNSTGTAADALLVPSPSAMSEEIAAGINNIGFLPARAIDSSVKVIEVKGDDGTLKPTSPILAIGNGAPTGLTAEWLVCLQAAITP